MDWKYIYICCLRPPMIHDRYILYNIRQWCTKVTYIFPSGLLRAEYIHLRLLEMYVNLYLLKCRRVILSK